MIEHRPKSALGRSDLGSFKALHHIAVGGDDDSHPAHNAVGNLSLFLTRITWSSLQPERRTL